MSDHLRGVTARSLDLLKAIDGAIEALVMTRKEMEALRDAFQGLHAKIIELDVPICEKSTIGYLEQAQDSLTATYSLLLPGLEAARKAPELKHDDGVVEAYEETIESVTSLNETIELVRWSILEHNADLEGPHKPQIMRDASAIDDFLDSL
ncbi:hypothetical protein [Azotobacter chroococcum]|uniref:hypothetical protein n=1 Tax=Azotobacter chroococcum TaxID=353 RepID=UPI0010ADCBEA|nr:hypothetical protein [Azotobacter chroococcum]TKD32592.1 hypothetical protein FCG41_21930 [Azotobacter chroococcum]